MKKGFFLATSFRIFYMRLIGFCFLYFSLVATGSHAECPLQLNPQRVVVKYGGSVSVDCKAHAPLRGMGLEANERTVPMTNDSLITWRVSNLTEWVIEPYCYINLMNKTQCTVTLPLTIYKTPDNVSISTVNHNGPMMEGNQYELQCVVLNVAPVQYLVVNWYKGQTLVDQIIFTDTIKTPVNITSKLLIRPDRADDGAQYWCEAELELGEEGPQPPPNVTSDPLSITVYSAPIINETKLPSTVPVFRGYPEVIVCEAEGNPTPTISWNISTGTIISKTLTITESTPEDLHCIATNSVGRTTRHVQVSIQDIFISAVNHSGPMIVGKEYELQCDVHTVAKSVVVRLYRRQHLVNETIFTDTFNTSDRKTSKLPIHPNKTNDGAQYWCEGELELGEGPQKVTSDPLSITVYFAPIISKTKLPSTVPVFRGHPEVIVCEAEGNPTPTISWNLSTTGTVNSKTLTITESTPEDLHCIATNSVNTTIRHVKVSIQDIFLSAGNHSGPMIVGKEYELQCDVHTVAKSVDVRLYRRQHLVNETIFTDTFKTSDRKTSKFLIRPDRADDGDQYWCEAELALGEGRPPKVTSKPLNITVYFAPIISVTKLPSTVPVFRGYPEVIVCKAEGNPKPEISWNISTTVVYNETLTITESTPKDLLCIANNSVGRDTRNVKVVLKEDYLPLIAGLVAITVAFISVIFIFIFSIYYKTAKMGRYNLKDAKLSPQNGDIAQNGKDNSIPMKKLSQSNILA